MTVLLDVLRSALSAQYDIEREIGGGGLSRVYLATDRALGRRVVLKLLPPELASSMSLGRFRRETELAAKLQHPHIVPLHAAGMVEGIPYYTMPFVEGESLRARLVRVRTCSAHEVVLVMRDVAEALSYAHSRGIVHRDIKPDNILLAGTHALVTDFGVAKAIHAAAEGDDRSVTSAGIALGTPAYMAPEQAVGDPEIDHHADLYALGVVAYELLVGETPFSGRSAAKLLAAHAVEQPVPLLERAPLVPPALAALIMQCLEKEPAARPRDAETIVRRLEALATPASTASTSMSVVSRPRRHRRRKLLVLSGATLLLLLAAGITLMPAELRATMITLLTRDPVRVSSSRVLVVPFENQLADTTIDALGVMAADWIGQALAQVPGVEAVDARTAQATGLVVAGIPWPLRKRDKARAMAEEVGAAILVTGSFYRERDTVVFQARITHAATGRLMRALTPIAGPVEAPSHAIRLLQQRVTASLAQAVDTTSGLQITSFSEPPTVEAYRQTFFGLEKYFRGDTTMFQHFERAMKADSSYALPLALYAFARAYRDHFALTEAALARADRLGSRVAPAELAMLEHARAIAHGEPERAMQTALQFARLTPGSMESPLLVASIALARFRPNIALAALREVDPDRGLNLAGSFYWEYQAEAAHQLGDYSRMLEMSRSGQRRFPLRERLRLFEARALVHLGRLDDMHARLRAVTSRGDPVVAQARVALGVTGALAFLGRQFDVRALAGANLTRLQAVRADTALESQVLVGEMLLAHGDAREARNLFSRLLDRPTSPQQSARLQALSGVATGLAGDTARARMVRDRLSRGVTAFDNGRTAFAQGMISAALGERDQAVALLRAALEAGYALTTIGGLLHDNLYFASLRDHPDFVALAATRR